MTNSHEERRQCTIELLLTKMGELTASVTSNGEWLKSLDEKVGKQNGRVGDLEKWKSFVYGMNTVVILLLIPIVIKIVTDWLQGKL